MIPMEFTPRLRSTYYDGLTCPSCGYTMTSDVNGYQPMWSSCHDAMVCQSCVEAQHLNRQTIIIEITLDVDADVIANFPSLPGMSIRNEVDPPLDPALHLGYGLSSELAHDIPITLRRLMRSQAKVVNLNPVIVEAVARLGVKFETDPAL